MAQWISPKKMVLALYGEGLTYRRIARESHLNIAAILNIANGTTRSARVSSEVKIRDLYEKYFGKEEGHTNA